MSTTKPLLAFYGATGGCLLATIVPALQAGYDCNALARTPSKLTSMLLAKGVAQSALDAHLHITAGDVLEIPSVKANLLRDSSDGRHRTADIIFSGVGVTTFADIRKPITLCATAASNVVAALTEISPAQKPLLVAISTTGITRGKSPVDLPFLMKPLYAMIVHPHDDKINMQRVIEAHAASSSSQISGFVLPRPSFLLNGAAKGAAKVKVGTEARPAVGYTINRDDVGTWLFENLVQGDGAVRFRNEKPTLTY